MTTTVQLLPHDQAVVAALKTIDGGHPVGFAKNPAGALEGVLAADGPDFIVVWPISGLRDGNLEDPYRDVDLVYQFTCTGRDGDGVRWLVDQIEMKLPTVTIPGRSLVQVIPEDTGAVRLDDDVRPELDGHGVNVATPRYRLSTTPS